MTRTSIKITNAALDETPEKEIILRGVIDPGSLHLLKIGDYQREVMPLTTINRLIRAIEAKETLPDIEVGMRGETYTERDDAFYLQDDVYIVDGLQRVSAALHLMKTTNDILPRLGAAIHFDTTEVWERERFKILNADRNKLSPNVLLRNLRTTVPVMQMLYLLTHDKSFVLNNRVCWAQHQTREHLITALTFLRAAGTLHSHFGPGRAHRMAELAGGLQTTMEAVGRTTYRDNIKVLFELIDSCWGIRVIAFKEGATHLKATFLTTLALIFSRHKVFWRGTKFFVEKDLARKIKGFPITDPQVRGLASAGGKARDLLYQLMLNHINSGKRTGRLGADTLTTPSLHTKLLSKNGKVPVASAIPTTATSKAIAAP